MKITVHSSTKVDCILSCHLAFACISFSYFLEAKSMKEIFRLEAVAVMSRRDLPPLNGLMLQYKKFKFAPLQDVDSNKYNDLVVSMLMKRRNLLQNNGK